MWTTHPDLGGIIKSAWDGENNILIVISSFQKKNVTTWNRNTFGNIFYKLKIIAKRLEGIHKSLHYGHSTFQTNLNEELIKEHNYLLKVEEDFWKLRSRVIWLNDGDANTRFFHTTTLNKRQRNKIIVRGLDIWSPGNTKHHLYLLQKPLHHWKDIRKDSLLKDRRIPNKLYLPFNRRYPYRKGNLGHH